MPATQDPQEPQEQKQERKTCMVEGDNRPAVARGLCVKHYHHLMRTRSRERENGLPKS